MSDLVDRKKKSKRRIMLRGMPLSKREREVSLFVKAGLENEDIAHRLKISYQTIKNHLTTIYSKLGIKNRTQLAIWIINNDNDYSLSHEEFEVSKFIYTGLSNKEIAFKLGISTDYVGSIVADICRKLNVEERVHIGVWYLKNAASDST